MILFTAPVWLWTGGEGRWHFVTVPAAESLAIRAESFGSRGFGSVKVEAVVGNVRWRTSVFPHKDGTYLLPVKADIRRRCGIVAGDSVGVRLQLL